MINIYIDAKETNRDGIFLIGFISECNKYKAYKYMEARGSFQAELEAIKYAIDSMKTMKDITEFHSDSEPAIEKYMSEKEFPQRFINDCQEPVLKHIPRNLNIANMYLRSI